MNKYIGKHITIEPEASMVTNAGAISWDKPIRAKVVGKVANRYLVELETPDQHDGTVVNVTDVRVHNQLGR